MIQFGITGRFNVIIFSRVFLFFLQNGIFYTYKMKITALIAIQNYEFYKIKQNGENRMPLANVT